MNTIVPDGPTTDSLSSFADLFGRPIRGIVIKEIEIPLIQRDYAQGRKTETVRRIRDNFIGTLCSALTSSTEVVDLDFVFGDVEASGKFFPLDGQQRLTTLFLLHCYLAWRNGVNAEEQPWSHFSYATRPAARNFCGFLVMCRPDFSGALSAWIRDQAAYLPTWEHDPSIQSMLTVLDTLHLCFGSAENMDFQSAWNRLLDTKNPAIRFHVLPMAANGLTDKLYIKMNSRGKPLTPFENFKAHFEALLGKSQHKEAEDFTKKVDKDWSDILWPYRDTDNLIDNEFMRYFRVVTEINAWKAEIEFKAAMRDDDLAELVYRDGAPNAEESVRFLFQAFDVWKGKNISQFFSSILTSVAADNGAVLMFHPFERENVNLFHACCRHYGTRQWSLSHTLLLYGVLLSLIKSTVDFPTRLRVLRNLIEASDDEIRVGERNNMPKLLEDTAAVVERGDLQAVTTFNQAQVRNEREKAAMLSKAPALELAVHALEDHDLLRGGLTVFDFDSERFEQRARAFLTAFNKSVYPEARPWKPLTGALLAQGDYSRRDTRGSGHRLADFGAPKNDDPWRALLRGKKWEKTHPASSALMALLDELAEGSRTLNELIQKYLEDAGTPKDWRYYFVRYDVMRDGASGRYTISPGGGYQACMLDKERLSSNYSDPYLLAIVDESGISTDSIANANWPRSFSGFESDRRTLDLKSSGLKIQSVAEGWQINGTLNDSNQEAVLTAICGPTDPNSKEHARLLPIPQVNGVDTADRIEIGAVLLRRLVAAGF